VVVISVPGCDRVTSTPSALLPTCRGISTSVADGANALGGSIVRRLSCQRNLPVGSSRSFTCAHRRPRCKPARKGYPDRRHGLTSYKMIIYRNLQSPCISRDIRSKLEQFVKNGGTVITGGYFIGAEGTWLGEDNARDWWRGLRLIRNEPSDQGITTVRCGRYTIDRRGTFQYLVPDSGYTSTCPTSSRSTRLSRTTRPPSMLTEWTASDRWRQTSPARCLPLITPPSGMPGPAACWPLGRVGPVTAASIRGLQPASAGRTTSTSCSRRST